MEKADARALLGIGAGASDTEIEAAYRRNVDELRTRFETARGWRRTQLEREFGGLGEARDTLLAEPLNSGDEPRGDRGDDQVIEGPSVAHGQPVLPALTGTEVTNPDEQNTGQTTLITERRDERETQGEPAKNGAETIAAKDLVKPSESATEVVGETPQPRISDKTPIEPSVVTEPPSDKSLRPPQPQPRPLWRNPWLIGAGAVILLATLIFFLWPRAPYIPTIGKLIVNTIPPQANVLLDDTSRGATPLLLNAVSSGEHRLTIELEGYESVELIVSVKGGDEQTLSPIRLVKKKSSPAPGPNPSTSAANPVASSGERYPQTRLRVLTEADITGLDFAQLRYAINEMYARHGAPFPKEPEIETQFRKFEWYHPIPGRTEAQIEASFSPLEKYNMELLARARDQKRPK
jgi:hypothetical protein